MTEDELQPDWKEWLNELQAQNRIAWLNTANGTLLIAAERVAQLKAIFPNASVEPAIAGLGSEAWSPEEALVELVRGRLEGLGPCTEEALACSLGLEKSELTAALVALETEGFAMRGRFTPGTSDQEWCERRLLARIHRYTVKRLRAEIEPVAAREFMQFLLDWQHVSTEARMEGPDAVGEIVGQLQGFEAPAGAWETEILPARLAQYDSSWLDEQCFAGRITWGRLRPRNAKTDGSERRAAPVRSTPIVLLPRRSASLWGSQNLALEATPLTSNAQVVVDFIRENGALFFDELVEGTRLLRVQVEEALAELVALGIVTSDSFGGLRALLVPSSMRRPVPGGRRRRRSSAFGMENAGRWALARRQGPKPEADSVEHIARALLHRYGVVFWRLLEREAVWLPPWRDLLRVYRRLEARGEIRGGRFVSGFSGEQFALPEAIGRLRALRRQGDTGTWISVSGADPLNLVGIIVPGPKLPALTGNRVLYRDGIAIALLAGGEAQFLEELDGASSWEASNALLRSPIPQAFLHLS